MSPGVEACVQLNRFDEAILFCDKGLAVSFKHSIPCSTNTPFFALCVSKVWKMERKDTLFWTLHVQPDKRKRNSVRSNQEIKISL